MKELQRRISELRSALEKVDDLKNQIATRERDQTETAARIKAAKESGAVDDAETVRKLADDLARAEMLPAKLKQLRGLLPELVAPVKTCLTGVDAYFDGLTRTAVHEAETSIENFLAPLLGEADARKYAHEIAEKAAAVKTARSQAVSFARSAFLEETNESAIIHATHTLSRLIALEKQSA